MEFALLHLVPLFYFAVTFRIGDQFRDSSVGVFGITRKMQACGVEEGLAARPSYLVCVFLCGGLKQARGATGALCVRPRPSRGDWPAVCYLTVIGIGMSHGIGVSHEIGMSHGIRMSHGIGRPRGIGMSQFGFYREMHPRGGVTGLCPAPSPLVCPSLVSLGAPGMGPAPERDKRAFRTL